MDARIAVLWSSMVHTAREPEPLDAHIEAALRFIAANEPVVPVSIDVQDVTWGGESAPWIGRVEIDPLGDLRLEATPPHSALRDDPSSWRPSLFKARVISQGILEIERAHCDSAHATNGVIDLARLEASRWRVSNESSSGKTKLWISVLHFAASESPWLLRYPRGNVFLKLEDRGVRAWRFTSPNGLIFLVPNARRRAWQIAFEAQAGGLPPMDDHVMCVIATLSFALGVPFHIGVLQAISDDGAQGELIHLGLPDLRPSRAPSDHPAVPFGEDMADEGVANLIEFVELALAFMSREGERPLLLAFHLYGASYEGFVDAQFLLAWIAAEAVAGWALENKKLRSSGIRKIADIPKWKRWLRQHKSEIRELAEPGSEVSLFDTVMACHSTAPSDLQKVFRGEGLRWDANMDEAESIRNSVVHEGAMCGTDPRNWDRDLPLVALAQTMATATVAMLIGYDGPIANRGDSAGGVPDWWRTSEQPAVTLMYVSESGGD